MSTHNMTAVEVVTQIRAQVEEKTSLTISAGIAANRMLAKVHVHSSDKEWQMLMFKCLRSALTKTSQMANLNWHSTELRLFVSCEICLSERFQALEE